MSRTKTQLRNASSPAEIAAAVKLAEGRPGWTPALIAKHLGADVVRTASVPVSSKAKAQQPKPSNKRVGPQAREILAFTPRTVEVKVDGPFLTGPQALVLMSMSRLAVAIRKDGERPVTVTGKLGGHQVKLSDQGVERLLAGESIRTWVGGKSHVVSKA